MICGVDEAGRGPVIGPLVVAGVCVGTDDKLKELHVRDSKKCTPKQREKLEPCIRNEAKCEVIVLPAGEIDLLRGEMTLNRIEAKLFATVIERLKPDIAYVDAADTDEENFAHMIRSELKTCPEIVSRHKADETYPVVSAASIIAKVRRDAEIRKIEDEIGEPIGSGYPSDPATIAFLEKWLKEKGSLPPHTRQSWSTILNIQKKLQSRNLEEWGK